MSDQIINLNVGGVNYTTSLSTLTKFPDSMLHGMFCGSLPSAMDTNGAYVIDRDGRLFVYILNFLRDGELNLPENFSQSGQLRREADFFQIEALTAALEAWEAARTSDAEDEMKNCLIIHRKGNEAVIHGPEEILNTWDNSHEDFHVYFPYGGFVKHRTIDKRDLEHRLAALGCKATSWEAIGFDEWKTKWKIPPSAMSKVRGMRFPVDDFELLEGNNYPEPVNQENDFFP